MSKTRWITRHICISTYTAAHYRSIGLYIFGYSLNFSVVGRAAEKQSTNLKYVDDLMDVQP